MRDHPFQTKTFAAGAGGVVWWVIDQLYQHGPSWQVVPPLLFGTAAILGAVRGLINDRQLRRIADEKHAAEMRLLIIHGYNPGLEKRN